MKPSKRSLERDLEHAEKIVADLTFRLINGAHLTYKETQYLKEGHKAWTKKVLALKGKVAKAT